MTDPKAVIASAAKQSSFPSCRAMDCFAALAMTQMERATPSAGFAGDDGVWLLCALRRLSQHVEENHRDKFCSSKFSALPANTCMLESRSLLPVSSVIVCEAGPATAMQLWPAASP